VSERLPPRIPRGEAVGYYAIRARLFDIEQQVGRVNDEVAANQREYDELRERLHFLVSEHDRLRRKLMYLDEGAA
jgi:cell division protein FtsB